MPRQRAIDAAAARIGHGEGDLRRRARRDGDRSARRHGVDVLAVVAAAEEAVNPYRRCCAARIKDEAAGRVENDRGAVRPGVSGQHFVIHGAGQIRVSRPGVGRWDGRSTRGALDPAEEERRAHVVAETRRRGGEHFVGTRVAAFDVDKCRRSVAGG